MANSQVKQQAERICVPLSSEGSENSSTYGENKTSNEMNLKQEQFNEILIKAIDEVLSSLGEPVKNTFYQHLENDFKIPKDKIPQNMNDFEYVIHKIFGLGASRLEITFVKSLSSKVNDNLQCPEREWQLSERIVMEMSFEEHISKMRLGYEGDKPC